VVKKCISIHREVVVEMQKNAATSSIGGGGKVLHRRTWSEYCTVFLIAKRILTRANEPKKGGKQDTSKN
jgi:hypothetical protein